MRSHRAPLFLRIRESNLRSIWGVASRVLDWNMIKFNFKYGRRQVEIKSGENGGAVATSKLFKWDLVCLR